MIVSKEHSIVKLFSKMTFHDSMVPILVGALWNKHTISFLLRQQISLRINLVLQSFLRNDWTIRKWDAKATNVEETFF